VGNLLGTPPSITGARIERVSVDESLGMACRVDVDSFVLHDPDPESVVAFAIDQPRVGETFHGAGFEINGWVIGGDAPLHTVRATMHNQYTRLYPLGVRRPDVAAAYPVHPSAGSSGFSGWAPVDPNQGAWQLTLEAVMGNGDAVMLAEIQGRTRVEPRLTPPGTRIITAPDFVTIGTQRGGTTSLHAYLGAHPRVSLPSTKELHFVTDRYERGLDWYLGQFPAGLAPGTLTGEATPYALFHPLAPRRLREIAPEAKLIVLLRNPVDRAYSHYLLERARGDELLEFSAALDAEPHRLKDEEARLSRDPTYRSAAHRHYSYAARGDYAPQLERWFEFFPREQILVVHSEDLYQRSAETYARVARYLGIEPEIRGPFAVFNQTSGPPLDRRIRARLSRHFAPLNARLADLLGWDPGWA
jgi:hypothetical protein